MKEVLLPIGTVCLIQDGADELEFMIIGQRQYNPHSGRAWDYISIPYPCGYNHNNKNS